MTSSLGILLPFVSVQGTNVSLNMYIFLRNEEFKFILLFRHHCIAKLVFELFEDIALANYQVTLFKFLQSFYINKLWVLLVYYIYIVANKIRQYS